MNCFCRSTIRAYILLMAVAMISLGAIAQQPAQTKPVDGELLQNRDFSNGANAWYLEQNLDGKATTSITTDGPAGQHAYRVEVTNPGKDDWHIQLRQVFGKRMEAQPYILSFWAKASDDRDFTANIGQAYTPYGLIWSRQLHLSTDWKQFVVVVKMPKADDNPRLLLSGFGKAKGIVWFADMSLGVVNGDRMRMLGQQGLLTNGNFSGKLDVWKLEQNGGAQVTLTMVNDAPKATPSLKMLIQQPGKEDWHIQLSQLLEFGVEKRPYTISFWAKSSTPTKMVTALGMAHDPWTILCSSPVQLTTDWQQYRLTVSPSQADANARFLITNLGKFTGTIWIADLSLTEVQAATK
ncbi:MAG TPA: carbohydrate binding domain-containing protein [Armatimonadota bacterium]|nr:carbohydrate binding domain-containing protein [Armatimonadota bacterium]